MTSDALIKKSHPWIPVSRLKEVRAPEPLRRLILIEGESAFEFDLPAKLTEDSGVSSFKVDRKEAWNRLENAYGADARVFGILKTDGTRHWSGMQRGSLMQR